MKYQLQVLGAATYDGRASVAVPGQYLTIRKEGLQRFLNDRSRTTAAVNGAKTRSVFITRSCWATVGGLPGLLLTLADAGGKGCILHGPSPFVHALAAMRSFVFRPQLPVLTTEYPSTQQEYSRDLVYHDANITVTPVILLPSSKSSNFAASPGLSFSAVNANNKRVLQASDTKQLRNIQLVQEQEVLGQMFSAALPPPSNSKSKRSKIVSEPAAQPLISHPLSERRSRPSYFSQRLQECEKSDGIVAYVCQGPQVLGKFDVVAAKTLGVPAGPLFGKLQKGESITLSDGTIVESKQCCAPAKLGAASTYAANPVQCIVHLLGDKVLSNSEYKTWMNSFPADCQHIVSSIENCPQEILLHATADIQHRLNKTEPAVFPIPFHQNEAKEPLSTISGLPPLVAAARPLLVYQFEPKRLLDTSAVLGSFQPTEESSTDKKMQNHLIEAEKIQSTLTFGDPDRPVAEKDVIIVPLGTGAAIPSKYRNGVLIFDLFIFNIKLLKLLTTVSSTYLRFSDVSILLDCGENTLGQMFRHFGPEKLDEELKMVRCLFVSHLHADHHLGAISILKRISELNKDTVAACGLKLESLCVVGPTRYLTWLKEYSDVEDFGIDNLVLIDSKNLISGERRVNSVVEKLKSVTKMKHFEPLLVKHCADAFAVVFTHEKSGLKIAFSGDCRPSNKFVEIGANCDLVIHEATLDDDKKTEAIEKNHCTTTEAIDIAQRIKAVAVTSEETKMSIGVAFDSMRVRLSEFHNLQALYKPLDTLWGDVVVVDEDAVVEDIVHP
ncbi:Zinc phosphodiesterase ELAC protein 2 [Physocladia obscura]|uniref:ribonuclease Z n=1 Tax=Physocladia obscura TaxID=109957 RepID=A0AAD5XK08_9FUNG|nr:Zinc phosphodiesterase ELAC protein 2 [Physocladia obscura]